jgi:hypothetical protein
VRPGDSAIVQPTNHPSPGTKDSDQSLCGRLAHDLRALIPMLLVVVKVLFDGVDRTAQAADTLIDAASA